MWRSTNTVFGSALKCASNTEEINPIFKMFLFTPKMLRFIRRYCRCCHLPRKLKTFGVNKNILQTFYLSFIESFITFSITGWFHSKSAKVKIRSKAIGLPVRALSIVCEEQTLRTARRSSGHLPRSVSRI